MTFPLPIPEPLRRRLPPGTGVLLGLSGGVDSAVTLALLRALECDVQCVTFKNFCYAEADDDLTEKSCCSLDAIDEARRLAGRFGAPHWVGDVVDPFRVQVIEPFVAAYARAETPNPCLDCNAVVRFPELVRLAGRQGCAAAATGHYARVAEDGGRARLLRGVDPAKDQSYFLHRLPAELLDRLVFPLGWYRKEQVREAAAELGLPMAAKADSQEICFVPDGDRSFLFRSDEAAHAAAAEPGDIVDRTGRVLGRHRGLIHYTVGQRRGLGVAAPEPLYVLELDLPRRRLVVGLREDLALRRLAATDFRPLVEDFPGRWPAAEPPAWDASGAGGAGVTARVRHRHAGVAVAGWRLRDGRLVVDLAEDLDGAAPGQGLALYAGDLVLGGGRLVRDEPGED